MWRDKATRQLGLISAQQLIEAGVSERQRHRLFASGALIEVHRRVYRVAGAPVTMPQRRAAAVLAVDEGALSHLAAASVWGAGQLDNAPPELVVPYKRSIRLPGVVVHRTREIGKSDVLVHGPYLRITRPAITLLHVAELDAVADDELERIGADLLLGYPRERKRVLNTLSRLKRRGRRGPARIQALFGEYLEGDRRPPHPGLERKLLAIVLASTLPKPVVHMKLATPMGEFEVDLAWPDVLLVVEADSARWHSSPAHLRTDRARDQATAMVGWLTLRVTWEEVDREPDATIDRIRTVRAIRQSQLRPAG